MCTTQIIWNFKTTSMAYLVKLEDRRSLQDSQPNYALSSFIVFFSNWICNCRKSNKYVYVAYKMRIKRGRLPSVQVYIEAKRKVSHSTKFSELSGHFQTYKCL